MLYIIAQKINNKINVSRFYYSSVATENENIFVLKAKESDWPYGGLIRYINIYKIYKAIAFKYVKISDKFTVERK